jgi:hypothetical protein
VFFSKTVKEATRQTKSPSREERETGIDSAGKAQALEKKKK